MFALAFGMLLLVVGERYEMNLLFVFSIIFLVGILIFSYFYANIGGRFKKVE